LGIELDDLVGRLVDDPDIVLGIDAHLLGEHEAVDALSNLADERSVVVELEQSRAAMDEDPRPAERRGRMAGPRIDENVAPGVGGDSR